MLYYPFNRPRQKKNDLYYASKHVTGLEFESGHSSEYELTDEYQESRRVLLVIFISWITKLSTDF